MSPAGDRGYAAAIRALALAAPLFAGAGGLVGCAPSGEGPRPVDPTRPVSPAPSVSPARSVSPAQADSAVATTPSAAAPTASAGSGEAPRAGRPIAAESSGDLPIPPGWMRSVPGDELSTDHRDARLIARLGHPEIDAAERWLGTPTGVGELRGWWLRPLTPRPIGPWLLFSVSGAVYGVVGPPALVDDPGLTALVRVGRSWASRLRRAGAD